jgi:uncharacterized protein (DUF433 family)
MTGDPSRSSSDPLTRPLYTFAEADRLAGVTRGTAQRWLTGYAYYGARGERVVQPPVTPGPGGAGGVSFTDLVEIVAIGRLKERDFSLTAIRRIVENCQQILGVPRPLTTLRFKTGGREIFVDQGAVLLEVGRRKGMRAWERVLRPYLETLDYREDGAARRWWPLGRHEPILVDPDYGFGLPVVAHSGVRTEIILERFRAGDLDKQIADDFEVSAEEVQRALQFELQRAA